MVFLMKNQQVFFFLLFVISLPISTLGTDSELIYHQCEKNFTQNHILQSNIGNLLMDMAAQSALHGFAISSSGSVNYDAVYGVARCEGDMSHEACSACIIGTEHDIQSICPGSGAVYAWREKCYLHYDITNFLGEWGRTYVMLRHSTSKPEDPKAFEQVLTELMGELIAEAAGARDLTLKFKSGESTVDENYKNSVTIYGMVQCTQDLGESECHYCLKSSLQAMADYCGGSVGCQLIGSGCVLRYEIYKFLFLDEAATGDKAPAPAPSVAAGY
ncbi:Cysteine-rich receptor-like protein kinase 26 [Platanthera zijinensis]|uniref:Cysteine-rich receptor-like protein kinase 26 n=1 Tax=Platanthera zijinensis TaxID=2320716 RepID=A0AAP0AX10_9ASPA